MKNHECFDFAIYYDAQERKLFWTINGNKHFFDIAALDANYEARLISKGEQK